MRDLAALVVALTIGLVIGWRTNGAVAAQSVPTYRVIGTAKDSTMERELNEAAHQGCEPIFGVGGSSASGEAMVVLKCP